MTTRLTPPPERDFPTGRLQLRTEHLVSEIVATTVPRGHGRRWRRALVAAVALGAAAVMAAAAYAGYLLTRPATHLESIGCYEEASLTANTAIVPSGSLPPAAACATMWSTAFPTVERPSSFAACVLDSGAIAVFPAGTPAADPCRQLGLPRLAETPETQREMRQFVGLRADLDQIFAGDTCLSYEQARSKTRVALDANGLSSWKIVPGPGISGEGFSSQRPCAGLAFDTAERTIILVPEEPHHQG
jgi:hypothetical protein